MSYTPDHLVVPSLVGHRYGTLVYDEEKNRFCIAGEPAMMEAARRLFPGANVNRKFLAFHNTRRVAEDLNWFLLRYPLDVKCDEALSAARVAAIEHAIRRSTNANISAVRPPSEFVGKLFPYQEEGVGFLLANERTILADGMGLGKTWTALAAAAAAGKYPVLVVVQTQVQRQWQRMIGALFDMPGTEPQREGESDWKFAKRRGAALAPILRTRTPHEIPKTLFAIIHYGLLAPWKDALLKHGFPVTIFDEVQELRHTGTGKYSAASLLSSDAERAWGLSGTPIYGYGTEIWSVTNALDFNCLGSEESFSREWCTGYGNKVVAQPVVLGDHLRREGLMLRRRWTEVRPQMPRVVRHVQDVEHDEGLHAKMMEAAVAQARSYKGLEWYNRGKVARYIDRESRHAAGVCKAPAVAAFVASLIAAGERPLVFAWHHDVHDILIEKLADFKIAVLTGRETEKQKDAALDRFIDGTALVADLSLRTAAGLDGLQTRATCTVSAELDWSPAIHGQCETRIARVGAPDEMTEVPSYYCVSQTGYDQVMMDVLGLKSAQFHGIVGDEPESAEERKDQAEAVARRILTLIERLSGGSLLPDNAPSWVDQQNLKEVVGAVYEGLDEE